MRKTNLLHEIRRRRFPAVILAFTLALCLSVFADGFSIVSHAESAGRVIASGGANVRSTASASGSVLTSYAQNDTVSIRSQIQASDGYTWYEVYVNADTLGYIRSDLVEITDGSTPPTSTQVAPSDSGNANPGSNPGAAEVTAVNPVSANVVGGGSTGVRIRSNASTRSQIVTTVQNGLALTVTGQANGLDEDGKIWYQVNFISGNSEVSGFIRSDFVELSEELTVGTDPDVNTEPADDEEPESTPEPEVKKDYETVLQDGEWYLVVTSSNKGYSIDDLFNQAQGNTDAYEAMEKKAKAERNWIIILVILLVAAVGAVAYLVFKIKDMMDSAYFNEVEKETLRRRSAQGDRKVMQTVGADKRGPGPGQRPAGGPGQRPGGAGQGQRPAGAGQGQRPGGAGQGQRPAGPGPGQRPAGSSQGQRPTGAGQGQRPAGNAQGQSAGAGQGQRPAGAPQGQAAPAKSQSRSAGSQSWQSKNFMADEDDEFEFEFLNYDGDEEQ